MLHVSILITSAFLAADPSGHIAFLTGTDDAKRCVTILDVGSKQTQPVGPGKYDGPPVWSPNGELLAFESSQSDGHFGVYVVHADGSQGHFLAADGRLHGPPAWSLDSEHLAFALEVGAETKIHVTDIAAGTDAFWGGNAPPMAYPTWTDNDRIIAVATIGAAHKQTTDLFWITESDAKPAAEIAAPKNEYTEWAPTAYPRQHAVAFESNDGGDREVFVYAQNIGIIDVSNNRAADWNPVWSPSGEWVAFESFRKGRRGIYRVNPVRILTYEIAASSDYDDWSPTWSPNSEWLAFISTRTGTPKLYITRMIGGDPKPLTDNTDPNYAPAWRPVPKKK